MPYTYDRVAADEAERERQHREGLAIEARDVSVQEMAARSLREMSASDLADLIANTPACEAAAGDLAYAVANLSDASWVVFGQVLKNAIVAEQERREAHYRKTFRSAAWAVLS